MENNNEKKNTLVGNVVAHKMSKTVVVLVERLSKHPKYGKFIKRAKKIKAHYEGELLGTGSRVEITPCAPISKDKHYKVSKVLKHEAEDAVVFAENE